MQTVLISAIVGIACLVRAKNLRGRGRGGRMTRDSFWVALCGLGAFSYAATLFISIVTDWIDAQLTALTRFVNSLLPFTLSPPYALLLVVGLCFTILGTPGPLYPYIKSRLKRTL